MSTWPFAAANFPFFPLKQMRKPYASSGSICALVGFHDTFYDAGSSRVFIHSCSAVHLKLPRSLHLVPCGLPFKFFVPFFIMMLSSGRTVRWMLCVAGYLCHSTGYFYTPPRSRLNCLFFDAILSGPHVQRTPSSICPFPYAEGYTLSASRAAGGEPPLLKVHIGDTHLCTNSAARAAGGETPLLNVQRGDMHLCINSAARAAGGEPPPLKAPRALRAPRKCRSSSGPGGHTPLSQLHRCGTVLGIRRSMSCCLGPASGSALVPDALPARTHTHTLRHPWACQYGTPVHLFHARLYLP